MFHIEFATVQPGVAAFNDGNVNDTYRGLVRTAAGLQGAIIKDLDPRQLTNELLIGTLAMDFNLPVPRCFLAVVPKDEIKVKHGPSLETGESLVFASVDMETPNLMKRLVGSPEDQSAIFDELRKWTSLGELYAFDTWTANIDRHPGNLLYGGKGRIWLIDHGHCLTGPNWKAADLVADASVVNRLHEWMTPQLTDSEKATRRSDVKKAALAFESFVGSDAVSRSRVGEIIGHGEAGSAETFLTERIPHVVKQGCDALDLASLA